MAFQQLQRMHSKTHGKTPWDSTLEWDIWGYLGISGDNTRDMAWSFGDVPWKPQGWYEWKHTRCHQAGENPETRPRGRQEHPTDKKSWGIHQLAKSSIQEPLGKVQTVHPCSKPWPRHAKTILRRKNKEKQKHMHLFVWINHLIIPEVELIKIYQHEDLGIYVTRKNRTNGFWY